MALPSIPPDQRTGEGRSRRRSAPAVEVMTAADTNSDKGNRLFIDLIRSRSYYNVDCSEFCEDLSGIGIQDQPNVRNPADDR